MDENTEAVKPAESPMAQPGTEQEPEFQHTTRVRKPRARKSAGEPEQVGGAADNVLRQAQANGKAGKAEGGLLNDAKRPFQVVREAWQNLAASKRDPKGGRWLTRSTSIWANWLTSWSRRCR